MDIPSELENIQNGTTIDNTTKIRHLVISGGGQTGLTFYGILRESNKYGLWSIENIRSIYATSIGSFIGVILCLKYDWDTLDNYFIKRPWDKVFKFDLYSIINAFEKKGIFDIKLFEEMFSPLFLGMDIPISITMKEFYELNNIDLHIYTTELNNFELIDISHTTHPDWRVIDAVYASSTLPIVFSPFIHGEHCYIDGGILLDYPIQKCLNSGAISDEILGIFKENPVDDSTIVNEKSNFFDYLIIIFKNIMTKILNLYNKEHDKKNTKIKHEIAVLDNFVSLDKMLSAASSSEERQRLIQFGAELFSQHIECTI
jgi:predicted acylesterase/phospholipase RssA